MTRKLWFALALLGSGIGPAVAQKAALKDSTVYRDEVPYCRMVRLNTSISSPRFSFKTLDGQVFAQAQHKPGDGFVLYFTELDTLVPIAPSIPYAGALAGMMVQYDLAAGGAPPDLKAVRRFARLEGRSPASVGKAFEGVAKEIGELVHSEDRTRSVAPAPAGPVANLIVSGKEIRYLGGRTLGQYTVRKYFVGGEAYKTIQITAADGRRVAEADLPAFKAESCKLRLPETHRVVTLSVPSFPEWDQVKRIAQYLVEHAYLE